jgi:hypothetical protein
MNKELKSTKKGLADILLVDDLMSGLVTVVYTKVVKMREIEIY